MKREIFGKGAKKTGITPSIALINPKFSRNLSQAVRACSCFGIEQCWFTGNRVQLELADKKRLPREERMKGYSAVDIIHYDYLFDQFKGAVPVGIELVEGAESLTIFEHPENALYIFGPEDGSIPKLARAFCHRFVFIPMKHCSNLAAAVYITLYDRYLKREWSGLETEKTTSDVLAEPRGWQQFENKYYGPIDKNFKDVTVKDMLEDK